MNNLILSFLQKKKIEIIDQLENSSIRQSLEEFNNTFNHEHSYNQGNQILARKEKRINQLLNNRTQLFKNLDEGPIVSSISNQLSNRLDTWSLNDQYNNFNGLFFVCDFQLDIVGIAFKENSFEVILDEYKSIEFENGEYAANKSIDFSLIDLKKISDHEEYENIIREFDNAPEIFQKVDDLIEFSIGICLHKALLDKNLMNQFEQKGFEKNGVIYFNQEGKLERTVYYNE